MQIDTVARFTAIAGEARAMLAMAQDGDFHGTMDMAARYASDVAAARTVLPVPRSDHAVPAGERAAMADALQANVDTVTLLAARRDKIAQMLTALSARSRLAHAYGAVVPLRSATGA
ncbi:MAG TPA: flagellar protein FliT [Nevskiaceae bacterium]|nr:flagellar protein FliT [Nevskiaceae bacterium]